MKRVSLFLEEKQIKKARALAQETNAPLAAIVRHALDYYFLALKKTGIKPRLKDGRVKL
jgi:predicted SprT family Zn-dependent metalloprotease